MKALGVIFLVAVGAMAQPVRPDPPIERVREEATLNAQLLDLQAQEAALSAQLSQVRQQHAEADPDVVALRGRIMTLESQMAILRDRDAALRGLDRDARSAGLVAELSRVQATLASSVAQESAANVSLADLRQRYTEAHPDVAAQKKKLAEIQSQEATLRTKIAAMRAELDNENARQASFSVPIRERWWRRASTVQSLGLTADQQKNMDDVFQQFRIKLIDANAALQRTEAALDPLVSANPLDDGKIMAQIDRVAEARAELEKVNGRMLLGIRKVLTPAQWAKLNASEPVLSSGSVLEQRLK